MSSIFVEMLTLAIIRWDEANKEKVRLEEKQRGVRKKREQEAELASQVNFSTNKLMQFSQIEDKYCILQEGRVVDPIEPHWFKLVPDPYNGGKMIHEYRGDVSLFMQHWAKKMSLLSRIFALTFSSFRRLLGG